MSNSFFDFNFKLFISIFILITIISCFFIPILATNSDSNFNIIVEPVSKNDNKNENLIFSDSSDFIWPLPGFNKITSNFGKRVSPTTGASSNHMGIDIAAPAGNNILCIEDGVVVSAKFSGAGGFTVVVKHNSLYTSSYCHVDPNLLVSPNQRVYKGQIIAKVGPKNVYNVPNNPYKDKNGNPTNGATTGSHLHFAIRKNGKFISPLTLYTNTL